MKTVLCYSGGVDSTVLLYDLIDQGDTPLAFGVDYGQRHRRELDAAKGICGDLGVEYVQTTVDAPFLNSELTDGRGGVIVPNRNMILIALGAAIALSHDAEAVAVACHADDADIFPDCRPAFLDAAWRVLDKATVGAVKLQRPYVSWTKRQIVERGHQLGVPFDRTWSCYRGGDEPCGRCLACRNRRDALNPFVLDLAENPHPVMLRGAKAARTAGGDYWDGYLNAMADATGEAPEALIEWLDRR